MSKKHKQKRDFFIRRNNEGIKKEKEAVDLSKLRIWAGMAAVSALLILSPVVISAAGSIANQTVQNNTGISESEQTCSPRWLPEDDSGTGNTAADTGSTLAAVPLNIGVFPADNDEERTESNDASTGLTSAKADEMPEENKGSREEDVEMPEEGGISKEEELEEKTDDSNTSRTSQSMTNREDTSESPEVDDPKNASTSEKIDDESITDSRAAADESQTAATNTERDQNEVSEDKEDADNADSTDVSNEDPNEEADSTDDSDNESENHEDGDREASSEADTDSESTDDTAEQDPELDNEDESSTVFSSYGSNDFAGAITPEIVRIPAEEWAAYSESLTGFLEREKDFFSEGTSILFDLKDAEHSTSILDDRFKTEKTEDGTALAIEAATVKDGTGAYENVVEYIFENAGSTANGEKVDLILSLKEAMIELPEDSGEEASGKIVVSSVSDNHIFRAEARSIPASTEENDADKKNEAKAVDVRVSEKWSARIIWHEGDEVAKPRTFLFIPDLDKVFGNPSSETCDRERVAMLSGFSGKAFCCEDASVSVSASGYLEGNGQPDAVILPVNSANIEFAWGGTNCSTVIFTGFDGIKPEDIPLVDSSEERTPVKEELKSPDNTTDVETDADVDSDTDTKAETNTEEAVSADGEEAKIESTAAGAAIRISYAEEPEKTARLSAGDTVDVSMKVKNSGSEILTDVEVSELLDDDAELTVAWDRSSDPDTGENTLSEGETVPVTVAYTVTQEDIDEGKLVRKAEASAEAANGGAVEDEQTSEVILRGTASIDFSKRASVQQISDARAGVPIQYFFTVTNSGDVTLQDIEVIDQMEGLSRIEYDWDKSTDSRTGKGILSPGEKVTASATYAITSDDIRKGRIVNKAFARGETLQGKIIECDHPEAPTSVSQEGKEELSSGSPATGDDTELLHYLMPFIVAFTVLTGAFVIEKIQRKKMIFDFEEKEANDISDTDGMV
ncbi:MAG: hypothetical protein Q4D81_08900 [Eubacteriales bacterium]|nr:hypothetical protein [Eubacteriales bacterium]